MTPTQDGAQTAADLCASISIGEGIALMRAFFRGEPSELDGFAPTDDTRRAWLHGARQALRQYADALTNEGEIDPCARCGKPDVRCTC